MDCGFNFDQEELEKLKRENILLKILCRFQWKTLGFYRTPYNYSQESAFDYPDGSRMLGILRDGGKEAQEAHDLAVQLGLTQKIIDDWPGLSSIPEET